MENERDKIAKNIAKLTYNCEFNDLVDGLKVKYLDIADWHISELAKAKQEGRKEVAREIFDYSDGLIIDIEDIKDKCQSILNEGASK